MITILLGLFIGWLLHFVGLNDLLHNMVGFSDQQYYLTWFILGFFIWLVNLIKK
jgi:hypothetical protein